MKKLILLAIALASLQAIGQGSANNTAVDNGLGGALGGADSTMAPTNIPSGTLPRTNEFGTPQSYPSEQPSIQEQQDPYENSGSLSNPSTPTDSDIIPPGANTTPSPTHIAPAPGAGTGATTSPPRGY